MCIPQDRYHTYCTLFFDMASASDSYFKLEYQFNVFAWIPKYAYAVFKCATSKDIFFEVLRFHGEQVPLFEVEATWYWSRSSPKSLASHVTYLDPAYGFYFQIWQGWLNSVRWGTRSLDSWYEHISPSPSLNLFQELKRLGECYIHDLHHDKGRFRIG